MAILNANIITLDPKKPMAEAVFIENERIAAVGSTKKIRNRIKSETTVIDANKKCVVPGLVDCHVHMTGFGQFLQTLELRNAASIIEVQQKLREYVRKNPAKDWILGGRWDHEKFKEKKYPTKWDLDEAVPYKPVFLMRVCGHIAVANTKALQLAGITKHTHVEFGQIELDAKTGEPNGILRENALDLVWKVIPKPTQEDFKKTCILACRMAVENGLTCVHWLVGSSKEVRILQELHSEGKLPLRICLGIPIDLLDELVALGLTSGFGNDMLKISFVKILADGSLGGRTAALKKPYSDQPETRGMMLYSQKKLNKLVSKAHEAKLQVAIHAIGDRAVEIVLKTFENALLTCPRKDHRHRIEHCSLLSPELIKRMKRSKLIASVQPHFVVSDFWTIDRVGKGRARWAFPFKTLMKEGVTVVSGSDCPVENISPVLGIWAATARTRFPEETLTLEEALKTYTLNAAYASFDEDKRGSIEVGKLADLTILSQDLSDVPADKMREVSVELTIVNGKIVYSKKP
jgi:predicted amidohydrolase YtcJ